MPKVGDKQFPYTPEGMAAAKAESQNMGIPVQDGANRSEQNYAGGGKTGYNMIGMEKPMMMGGGKMMKYEDGGKADKTPKNPKDKGVIDPAKKYEEGGKADKKLEEKGVKTTHSGGKGKKQSSKQVVNVGSVDNEAALREEMSKLQDKTRKKDKTEKNNINRKMAVGSKAKIDSLKAKAKARQNALKEEARARQNALKEKAKLKPTSKSADQALKDMKANKSVFDNQKSVFDK